MATSETDRRNHIREVQQFLRGISQLNPKIPEVFADGIFGKETVEAVKAFQLEYGLPVTGEVDLRTWNELVRQFDAVELRFNVKPVPLEIFPQNDGSFGLGDAGTVVLAIELMLDTISENYSNIPQTDRMGVFNERTENSVMEFQKRSGMERNGRVNRETWDILANTFNAHHRSPIMSDIKPKR